MSQAKMTPCPQLNSHLYSELQTQGERGDGESEGVRGDEGRGRGEQQAGRGRPETLMRQSPKELKFRPACLHSVMPDRQKPWSERPRPDSGSTAPLTGVSYIHVGPRSSPGFPKCPPTPFPFFLVQDGQMAH